MKRILTIALHLARSSEFWIALAGAYVAAIQAPIPEEFKTIGWGYVLLRVISKMTKFTFPNPENPSGGWMKADS